MGDAGFFKGTSSEQDTRFKDKEKSLLKSINFPKELDKKVDMRKVELSVMRPWIAQKIMELLGFEDEVVVEYVNGLLEDSANPIVDPKRMQINLTGFLESKTGAFMSELWALLISAQESPLRVPALFIEQKKEELRKREEADLAAKALLKQRQELEEEKERKLTEIRLRERGAAQNARDHLANSGQRAPPRANTGGGGGGGGGGHSYRNNSFMPPRDRDAGWGSRSGGRASEPRDRDDAPSSYRRERSRSPIGSRRGSHGYRGERTRAPAHRRRRSPSPSRSRSISPPPRRRHRRSPVSPRPFRRSPEPSRFRRRGSPPSEYRGARPPPSRSPSRSPSPASPQRAASRKRSPTRSLSPPRRKLSDTHLTNDSNPRDHSSRRRDGRNHSHRSRRGHSRSPSPPPRKRARDDTDRHDRGSSRREVKHRGRSISSSSSRGPPDEPRREATRPKTGRDSYPRERSPDLNSRISSSPEEPRRAAEEHEEQEPRKRPAVISIKGRASRQGGNSDSKEVRTRDEKPDRLAEPDPIDESNHEVSEGKV